jgi:N-acetylglucosaminyl-diphospho-decaprenol L-rhamnosyltransferase
MTRFDDLTLATTAHNNAQMCAAMLRSFEANVGCAAGVIVLDDGSASPLGIPSLASPVRVVRIESALGFCKASDRALREVCTDYSLLVDADVLFEPGDFAGGFAEFKQNNWAWVNFRQIDFGGRPQGSFETKLMPPWVFAAGNQAFSWWQKCQRNPKPRKGERIGQVDVAHSSCALVNMRAFRAVGGFDPWYWQCQSDVDLSLRLRAHGYPVGVDLGYTVRHHGAGGKSGDVSRVLDLYRARLHLYETTYPASRLCLRPILFVRHVAELIWFGLLAPVKKDARLTTRVKLLKGVWHGYD